LSLHVTYNHNCPQCNAFYIPYDDKVACPSCGLLEEERFDFISEAAESLKFNAAAGSYRPPAWWVGCLGDHILSILFALFDTWHKEKPDSFNEFAAGWVEKVNWGDQQYFKEHVLGIAVRLHEVLMAEGVEVAAPQFYDEDKEQPF
jgi:hypothetical protein